MLSLLSNSAFGIRYKTGETEPPLSSFNQFTYSMTNIVGGSTSYTLKNSPADYAVWITNGYTIGIINEMNNNASTFLNNKNATLYFKTTANVSASDGSNLFAMFNTNDYNAINTGRCLGAYRLASTGYNYQLVIGSQGTNYFNTQITGLEGWGQYNHTFITFDKDNTTLRVVVYNDSIQKKFDSSVTYTPSSFGTDYNLWTYNGRIQFPVDANYQVIGRQARIGMGGYWDRVISDQEMYDKVYSSPT